MRKHKHYTNRSQIAAGFTIVELLVVIVVIAILAAVTIVSYNGITDRAHGSALKNDLSENFTLLGKYNVDNSSYPGSQLAAGLQASSGTTLTYIPGVGNTSYCLQASGFSQNYYVTDASSNPTTGTCPSGPSPVVSYNFNAGTGSTVTDNSGNGNTLTFGAPSVWNATGHTGAALDGGGSGGNGAYIVGSATSPSPAITIMGWVKPTGNNTTDKRVLFGYFDSSTNTYFAIFQNRNDWGINGVIQVDARISGTLYELDYTPPPVGTWVHMAATYDGSTIVLYMNGVQVATKPVSGTLMTNNSIDIGAGAQALIDDVRFYNAALSSSQITTLMNIPV